jgi:hypothetical protein
MTSQNSVGGWGDDIQRTEIGAKFADALIKDYLKGHSNTLNPKIQESNISIELLKKYSSNRPVPMNNSNINNHFTEKKIREYLDLNNNKRANNIGKKATVDTAAALATAAAAEKLKELLVIKKSARSEVNKLQLPNKNKQNFLKKISNAPNANATNTIVANAKKSVNNAAQNATNMFQKILNNKGTNVKKQLSGNEKFKSLNKSNQEKILKSLNNGKTLNNAMKNINRILANKKVVANTVKGITERVIKKAEAENEKVVANTVKGITNRMIKENKNKLKELQIIRNSAKKEIIKLQLPNNKRTNLISKLNDAKNANQMNAISAQAKNNKAETEKKVAQEAERKALQEKKNKEEVSQVVKGITNKMIQNNRKQLRNMIQKANIGSKNKNRFLEMSKNSKISNTEIRKALNKKVANVKSFKNNKEAQEKRKQRAEVKSSNENANKATELFSQMTTEPKKAVNRLTEGEKENIQKQLNMAKPKERGLSKIGKKKLNARKVIEGRTNLNKNTINLYMKQVNNAKQAHVISRILKKLEKEKKKLPNAPIGKGLKPRSNNNKNSNAPNNKVLKPPTLALPGSETNQLALPGVVQKPVTMPQGTGLLAGLAASKLLGRGKKSSSVPKALSNKKNKQIQLANAKGNLKKLSISTVNQPSTKNMKVNFKFPGMTNKVSNTSVMQTAMLMTTMTNQFKKLMEAGSSKNSVFRKLSKQYHPNKPTGSKESMQILQNVRDSVKPNVVSKKLGEAMTPKKFLPKTNNKSPDVISKALGEAMAPKKQNKNLTKVLNKLSNKAPQRKGLIEKTINSAKKSTNIIKKLREKAKEEKNKEEVSKVVKGMTNRIIEKNRKNKSVSSGLKKVGAAIATAKAGKKVSNIAKQMRINKNLKERRRAEEAEKELERKRKARLERQKKRLGINMAGKVQNKPNSEMGGEAAGVARRAARAGRGSTRKTRSQD